MSKILIVDDDASVLSTFKTMLESFKHEVILASGGKEALEAAARKRPDLILLDIQMPDLDGLAVLKALKEDGKTALIPVIMVTGVDTQATVKEAMYWYTEQYVVKPCGPDQLRSAVDRVLATRKA